LGTTVVGLHIVSDEPTAADPSSDSRVFAADFCKNVGKADADSVIYQVLLDHVVDTEGAIRALFSMTKRGWRGYLFSLHATLYSRVLTCSCHRK
jgi:hypothetical protein